MKSVSFRRERQATWQELEDLVRRIERAGLVSLTPAQVCRLPVVYRATLSSLSVARAISLDANLLAYLESLSARAYVATYGSKRQPVGGGPGVRARAASRPRCAASGASSRSRRPSCCWGRSPATCSRCAILRASTPSSPRAWPRVEAPAPRTEQLRAVLYAGRDAADLLAAFAMFLFTHNAAVGMLCFATGFAGGVPTLLLLFGNGLALGAFGALYAERDLSLEFWAWVLPHGVTELLAVVLCGAAGLALGDALLFPGRHTRLASLARRGREAALVVTGSILMLLVAGLIEGIFRQTVHSVVLRLAVGAASAVVWLVYLARRPGSRP